MQSYEMDLEKNIKRNEKFIKEFKNWLKDKNLTPKTIEKHFCNRPAMVDEFNGIIENLNDYIN